MNKILIAEDDPNERDGLSALLKSSGFTVEAAVDGIDALERIQQEKFDLLLVDIWMPRMNGLDLLSRLPKNYRTKVVVMTGDDTTETLLRALREKAYQYITKPFDPQELLALIRSALESPSAMDQIQVLSAQPDWVEVRVPCDRLIAERIQDVIRHLDSDLPSEVRDSVGLAFHELLMNAIEWGGHMNPDSKVQIAYLRTKKLLLCRIADPGPGFKPAELDHAASEDTPDKPYEHTFVREERGLRPGGYGILLVKSLVDELVYNEAHNEVVMVKYLN
jgi:CheY-like chemotaxis protein/anti-sigma regulatory factor (Ser/Thr protein kinase)